MKIGHYLEGTACGFELETSDQGGGQAFWAGGKLSPSSAFVSR